MKNERTSKNKAEEVRTKYTKEEQGETRLKLNKQAKQERKRKDDAEEARTRKHKTEQGLTK